MIPTRARSPRLTMLDLSWTRVTEVGVAKLASATPLHSLYLTATAFYNLAWCYNDLERYNDAITALRSAIRLQPQYAEAYNEMGYSQRLFDLARFVAQKL